MVECNFAIRRKYKNQDMKYKLIIFVLFLLGGGFTGKAYLKGTDTVVANPLELHFHRLAVRRFIFRITFHFQNLSPRKSFPLNPCIRLFFLHGTDGQSAILHFMPIYTRDVLF